MRFTPSERFPNGTPRWQAAVPLFFALMCIPFSSTVSAVTLEVLGPVSPAFESDGVLDVTLRLSRDNASESGPCTIGGSFDTTDGSAIAGLDYQSLSTSFSLAMTANDNFVEQTLSVALLNDDIAEGLEDIQINLVPDPAASSCQFGLNLATPNFVSFDDTDDGAVSVVVNPSSVSVNEADGSVSFQVGLGGLATVDVNALMVSFDIATRDVTAVAGSDYTATSVNVFLDSQNPTQTITIPILDDALAEPAESFELIIDPLSASAVLADSRNIPLGIPAPAATVTILDDDNSGVAQLNANQSFAVGEGAGQYDVVVSRVGGSAGPLSVDVITADDTAQLDVDYVGNGGTVTWADGDSTDKIISVTILEDTEVEGNEDFLVALDDGSGNTLNFVPITIIDNDVVAPPVGELVFTSDSFVVNETAGTVSITVERVNGTAGAVSVDFLTSDGTATAGSGDYSPVAGTLSWTDGEAGTKTINVLITSDGVIEGGETFSITLANPQGGIAIGAIGVTLVTITDAARNLSVIENLSPNQLSVAKYIDNVCPRIANQAAPTSDQLDFLDLCSNLRDSRTSNDQVRTGLDALGGQQLAAIGVNTLRVNRLQHGNLGQRLNALHTGASGIDIAGLDLEIQGQVISGRVLQEMLTRLLGGAAGDESFGRWGLFANGKYKFGDKDGSQNEAQFDFDVLGITAGVDYRFRDNLVFGASLGYGSAEIDYGGVGGGFDMDSWNLSLFGTYFIRDRFYIDGLITAGNNDYDTVRRIVYNDIGGLVDRTATGNTDGEQSSIGLGSGYDFHNGKWTFGPHIGAYYLGVQVDGLQETGAGGLNLVVGDQGSQSFTVNAGGHASYVMTPSWGVLIPYLRFDLVQELQDSRELVNLGFVMDPFRSDPTNPSPVIVLQSDKPDDSYFIWAVGASAQFVNGVSGFVNYRSTGAWDGFSLDELTFGMRFEKSF